VLREARSEVRDVGYQFGGVIQGRGAAAISSDSNRDRLAEFPAGVSAPAQPGF
jgi:hypothetical protein